MSDGAIMADDNQNDTGADGANRQPIAFISHHSSQVESARHLARALERHGVRGWLAPDDIEPGKPFDQVIMEQIALSDVILLLFCSRSDQSKHVKREIMLAEQKHKLIYPIRLETIQPEGLAYWLQDYQWIDWLDQRDDAIDRMVATIRSQLNLPAPAPQTEEDVEPAQERAAPTPAPVPTPAPSAAPKAKPKTAPRPARKPNTTPASSPAFIAGKRPFAGLDKKALILLGSIGGIALLGLVGLIALAGTGEDSSDPQLLIDPDTGKPIPGQSAAGAAGLAPGYWHFTFTGTDGATNSDEECLTQVTEPVSYVFDPADMTNWGSCYVDQSNSDGGSLSAQVSCYNDATAITTQVNGFGTYSSDAINITADFNEIPDGYTADYGTRYSVSMSGNRTGSC